MHTLILFPRRRLKIEYLESLQELVLKKICRTVSVKIMLCLVISVPETVLKEI